MDNLSTENLQALMNQGLELAMLYLPKLLLAIVTLIAGFWIIGKIVKGTEKVLQARKVEATLERFLSSLISVGLKVMLIISVASMVGIETTSFVAVLGAAGLAIGLALQGSLSNFAGGVLILFFKPFKVGDVVDAQGYVGVIKEIQIFNTIVTTLDNERVIIPNGVLSNGPIKNLFAEPTRRVDMTYGISYEDNVQTAKEVIRNLILADKRLLEEEYGHEIYVSEHADSSVNLLVRVWCNSPDYWGVYFDMHEQVKLAFDEQGITIPYPQRDVHMKSA
ncbi:mechanosensitive ion channel [Psychrobium sp. MM17-31]|uniref:mechanosensitive ion channel family protein n=1 Tax=Psychrobium sp. MM17-31 TaxID=2917758 RepID=UPI001EF66211|nr:mechanosensitive ion channel domain-containing protein [Psychrobium sp. MM17-31]MCG7531852.1 mechanosensitive ion channel [Psychrobium sp. MM17-31]